jgi:hypothetical protein
MEPSGCNQWQWVANRTGAEARRVRKLGSRWFLGFAEGRPSDGVGTRAEIRRFGL